MRLCFKHIVNILCHFLDEGYVQNKLEALIKTESPKFKTHLQTLNLDFSYFLYYTFLWGYVF